MGLDLDMFQDAVPEDLVCALCRKVVVNPVHGAHCTHLFCKACLQRSEVKATCPTCGVKVKAKVKHASVSEPSLEVKVRLLGLAVRCSHQCGQTCTLAELPDHVAEECPNAPVACPHVQRGCKMTVKRKEVGEHSEECDYRQVQCEACGQRTLFMDLFTHQSRKRCLEKKLRQQLIKAVKITTTEVKLHRRHLERQSLRLERQQRQRLLDHRQTAVVAAKPHHKNHTSNTAKIEGGSNSGDNKNNSCNESELESTSVVSTDVSNFEPNRPTRDVFLTSANTCDEEGERGTEREREEEVSEKSTTLLTRTSPSPSRLSGSSAVPTCRNCKRHFRENLNAPNACRWHPGPIIELFGGTCYSCGRLDYQKGCMMGYHEL